MVDSEGRDRALLGWLGEMYGCPSDVARSLLGWVSGTSAHSDANVLKVRDRLKRAGWVKVVAPVGGPGARVWLVPTSRGCPGWRVWQPSPTTMGNVRGDCLARLWLEAKFDRATGYTPRRVLEREAAEQGVRARVHVPDGVVRFPGGDAAVEVERSRKSRGELERVLVDVSSSFVRVFYLCDRGVRPYVASAVERLERDGRIPSGVVDVADAPTVADVEAALAGRFPAPRRFGAVTEGVAV